MLIMNVYSRVLNIGVGVQTPLAGQVISLASVLPGKLSYKEMRLCNDNDFFHTSEYILI
jgi:hypothetical protein